MKKLNLLSKTTIVFLLQALAAFGIGSFTAVRLISAEVRKETEYSLIESYYQVAGSLARGVEERALENDKISIREIKTIDGLDTAFTYKDTMAMHPLLKRNESFRQLSANRIIAGKAYQITIMDVFLELDDIQDIVISLLTKLFLILGLLILMSTIFFSKFLFRPFHDTLQKIKHFNVKNTDIPTFAYTSTQEFSQLNDFLRDMLKKTKKDYFTLKEFSENASHEMQTPLAVAKSKLDVLLETPNLTDRQLILLEDANNALTKLSRLNEALLLLTRIDNREFITTQSTDFSAIVRTEVNNFKELAALKGISFNADIADEVRMRIDDSLAHILVSNLLKNAISHNVPNGWMKLRLGERSFEVENSGKDPGVNTDLLFRRFRKSSQANSSLGLGLSIVRKICDSADLNIHYEYAGGVHLLRMDF
jgi:signal transduction histidine kinase